MLYVISDKRDNTFYCGLNGWSNLEENALWYGDDSRYTLTEMRDTLAMLKSLHGDHFYSMLLPAEAN
jgi:hypothetical protein